MADSESLHADNGACRSHTSEFGVKFIPLCSRRAVRLKSDNGYSKMNNYDHYMGSIMYRHEHE